MGKKASLLFQNWEDIISIPNEQKQSKEFCTMTLYRTHHLDGPRKVSRSEEIEKI